MKKVSLIALAFALGLLTISCQKHAITARINGLDNDSLLVTWAPADADPTVDTIVAVGGKFNYDFKCELPVMFYIEPFKLFKKVPNLTRNINAETRAIMLMVLPGEKVSITGEIEPNYIRYKASGSQLNRDLSTNRELYKKTEMERDSLNLLVTNYRYNPNFADSAVLTATQRDSVINELSAKRMELRDKSEVVKSEYVSNNPGSDLSAYYLLNLSRDAFEKYYPTLTDNVKNGTLGSLLTDIANDIASAKAIQTNKASAKEGAPAPDFTLKNLKGDNFSLSSLKGKYIVLDFWGSWCGWCIKGIPDMKKYYTKYSSKVEFVGIDCRDSDEKWRAAVKQHDMPWIHVIDNPSDVSKSAVSLYAVEAYPTKIIISPDLKIVKIFRGESEDFYKALDSLLK